MEFNEYQNLAIQTAIYTEKIKELNPDLTPDLISIIGLTYAALGLGEAGEVQGKVKKIIRDSGGIISDDAKKEISKELGDILWYVAIMCQELKISMNDVAKQNIEKLFSRKERGVLTGNGDNR